MATYVIYKASNGEIKKLYDGDDPSAQLNVGELYLESVGPVSDVSDYVVADAVVPRPAQPTTYDTLSIIANGGSSCVFSPILGAPVCSIIVPDGADLIPDFEIMDGSLTFATNFAGAYVIKFSAFPHLDYIQTVTAT